MTTWAPRRPTPPCWTTVRPSTSRTPGAWTPRPTATTSSTSACPASWSTSTAPTSPSCRPTSLKRERPIRRPGWTARRCSTSTACGSASSGPRCAPRRSSCGPTPPPASTFTDEAEAIAAESERLRSRGVQVQIVVIHEGAVLGANRIANRPAATWEGPIIPIVEALQETSVDLVIAGHTHRIANTVVGRHPRGGRRQRRRQLLRGPARGQRRGRDLGRAQRPAWPRTSV